MAGHRGRRVVRELIEPFPDLPTTFELQGEELAKSERAGTQTQTLVQRILADGNIDVLSRGLLSIPSRFDSEYPSISNLAPFISAGSDHFIIRPTSDETRYNNQSAIGENGFEALRETIAQTNSPRRLKPFDVNYHIYSGEYPALLHTVKDQLTAARLAALTPVSANRYAGIVDGFLNARIERLDAAIWRISGRGALQTVRFDAAEGREVDFHSSVGVIGSKRVGRTLYVALDEKTEPVVVALAPPGDPRSPGGLSLVDSRWLVRDVVKDECLLRFEAEGYGDGAFTWSGAVPGRYAIAVDQAGQKIWQGEAETGDGGILKFVVPVKAIEPVIVRMNCNGGSHPAGQ